MCSAAFFLRLKSLIPFVDETAARTIAPEQSVARGRPGHHGPFRAMNAGSYLSGHATLYCEIGQQVGVSPAWMGGHGTEP